MDALNPNFDLDVSQLSAVELQRLGVTVAQVRAAYADPVDILAPEATGSRYAGVHRYVGLTDVGKFIFVVLGYVEATGRITAFRVRVLLSITEIRRYICSY
jgi:hypothetical protein